MGGDTMGKMPPARWWTLTFLHNHQLTDDCVHLYLRGRFFGQSNKSWRNHRKEKKPIMSCGGTLWPLTNKVHRRPAPLTRLLCEYWAVKACFPSAQSTGSWGGRDGWTWGGVGCVDVKQEKGQQRHSCNGAALHEVTERLGLGAFVAARWRGTLRWAISHMMAKITPDSEEKLHQDSELKRVASSLVGIRLLYPVK